MGTDADDALAMPQPTSDRYPDYLMPFAGSDGSMTPGFAGAMEGFLLEYGYNTARAYRADLVDIHLWATERGYDPLELTEKQLKQYVALLRRRQYSENTIRRRLGTLRLLLRYCSEPSG